MMQAQTNRVPMFEIYQSKANKKFHYRLKAANGLIILTGQGYANKKACEKGVASVKKNVSRKGAFHPKESKDGRRYFTLVASNGEVIGQSQMYKSASGFSNGIKSVLNNAPGATVNDLT